MPRVRLLPGGEEFAVEGEETILDAALFAGLALPYGCSAGNCGLCRARVISGDVRQVRHSDFRLSEAECAQGYTLLCCAAPAGDLAIEAAVAHGAEEIPLQRVSAHVRRKERLSPEVMLLELLTPRASRLRFLAGQSATLEALGAKATLPIASCPCEERRIHFHLCRDGGSAHAFEALRAGEQVSLEGPRGDFVLRESGERALLFVAVGREGFAPVKSVIEHAMSLEAPRPIDLLWLAAQAGEHYQVNLCRSWADAMDEFRFAPLVAPQPGAALDAELKAALDALPDLAARDCYLAGAPGRVAEARALLRARGVPDAQLIAWSPH